jgi:restriction system protein
MTLAVPKFHETFIPILKVLESGEELHHEDMKRRVKEQFFANLPDEILNQKTSSGVFLILNRIGWAKSYLKEGGFLQYPQRGNVKITAKGISALKSGHLTLSELKKDADYIATQQAKQSTSVLAEPEMIEKDFSPQDLIEQGFDTIKSNVKLELLERLKVIDPFYFEKVILILLKKMGYGEFIETKKTGDGGIDGIINQDQLGINKIYIQAKRYAENKVREKDIRNFIGAMSGDTTNGVFVTTSTFDDGAVEKAKQAHHKIILIDGNRLTDLMFQFGVGVQTISTYEMKEVDADFFEDTQ